VHGPAIQSPHGAAAAVPARGVPRALGVQRRAATYEGIDAEGVLVFAGAEEALFWALAALAGPNNPTGAMPDPATFEALVALCDSHGIAVLSDEVYRGEEAPGAARLRQAADLAPSAISLNVRRTAQADPGRPPSARRWR
jgi:aspartate/methionine/tyrosine aminotransferase